MGLDHVRWVGHLPLYARLRTNEKLVPGTDRINGVYTVEFFETRHFGRRRRDLVAAGAHILNHDSRTHTSIIHLQNPSTRVLSRISGIHGVQIVRQRSRKRFCNNVATRLMKTKEIVSPLDLSGEGEIISICDSGLDTGDMSDMHPDFEDRVIDIKGYPVNPSNSPEVSNVGHDDGEDDRSDGHGTHVAGSALGAGVASMKDKGRRRPIRGLAYKAQLVFQAVEQFVEWKDPENLEKYGPYMVYGWPDDMTKLLEYGFSTWGARAHSFSIGGVEPGVYDVDCRRVDKFVWDHKEVCIVAAVGNDGQQGKKGMIKERSVTSPACAKNCIAVGASETRRRHFKKKTYGDTWDDYSKAPYKNAQMADKPDQVAAFSSRGPTNDDRVRPDLVAPGTFILSTRSRVLPKHEHGYGKYRNKQYFYLHGTSMSTPLVSGAAAVMREYLREYWGIDDPSAALVKASLIYGAKKSLRHVKRDEVCDNHQGYGVINLDASVSAVAYYDVRERLETGEFYEFEINVRSSRRPLRIVMAYTDYPGETLINNLNLELIPPSGDETHFGGNGPGPDTTNNVEVIHIKKPRRGTWTLRVMAAEVKKGRQDFALVFGGRAEDVTPG